MSANAQVRLRYAAAGSLCAESPMRTAPGTETVLHLVVAPTQLGRILCLRVTQGDTHMGCWLHAVIAILLHQCCIGRQLDAPCQIQHWSECLKQSFTGRAACVLHAQGGAQASVMAGVHLGLLANLMDPGLWDGSVQAAKRLRGSGVAGCQILQILLRGGHPPRDRAHSAGPEEHGEFGVLEGRGHARNCALRAFQVPVAILHQRKAAAITPCRDEGEDG